MLKKAIGFTKEVVKYMQFADVFIGKSGGGSTHEALVSGMPVILKTGLDRIPQEAFMAE